MVYAILLRDKCNIPTIRIKGCTWDNEIVSVAAYMNRIFTQWFRRKVAVNDLTTTIRPHCLLVNKIYMGKMFKT